MYPLYNRCSSLVLQVWIDVLLQGGIAVEVCRVKEYRKPTEPGMKRFPKTRVIRVYKIKETSEDGSDAEDAQERQVDSGDESVMEVDDRDDEGVIVPGPDERARKRRRISEPAPRTANDLAGVRSSSPDVPLSVLYGMWT